MDKLKNKIIQIVRKNITLPHYKLFFFGSRVNGSADKRSDIDIGILGQKNIPLEIINEIKEELEQIPVLQKFDFVDISMASEDFKKIALEKIEVIYEQ